MSRDVIQHYRSADGAVPATLAPGELFFDELTKAVSIGLANGSVFTFPRPRVLVTTLVTKKVLNSTWQDILTAQVTPQTGLKLTVDAVLCFRVTNGTIGVRVQKNGVTVFTPNVRNSLNPFSTSIPSNTVYGHMPLPDWTDQAPGVGNQIYTVQAVGTGIAEICPDAGSGEPGLSTLTIREHF